ncbi:MAG: hypothetical protein M1821_008751 [Bathelium mastoideum]|nr:MAG: hypothetical protein M1821_008751 [Bathelium mastoideum]
MEPNLARDCGIAPIYVDIHSRNVTGSSDFQYGSFIGVGSPSQNQSLWPTFSQNEMVVADIHFCEHSDVPDCSNTTRGFFDATASSTWGPNNSYTSSDAQNASGDQIEYGNDIVHLFTHFYEDMSASATNITDLTFGMATAGNALPGYVGLGPSSTLLQTLVDKALIAGRTLSLYMGDSMPQAGGEVRGASVYGGFDSSRFVGGISKYPIDSTGNYPFAVTVTDVQIHDASGKSTSLLDKSQFPNLPDGSASFQAEIGTDNYALSLPYEITQNFASVIGASPGPDSSLMLNKPFVGNMTVTLSDGMTITLPGNITVGSDNITAVASRDENSTLPFYLGVAWLTQVYLMVDYDSSLFYLAQAVPWPPYFTPQTFCPGSTPAPYIAPTTRGREIHGAAGGAVGGVIGGLALLTVALCALRSFRRRRREQYRRLGDAKMMEMTQRGEAGGTG